MAWNEPGGGGRDPWSGKGGDQGPPDLDEVVRKLQNRLGGLFGGKGGGNNGTSGGGQGGGSMKGVTALILIALVVFLGFQAFYIVEAPERGVLLRFGKFNEVTEPGPHFLIPLVDQVYKVNVDQISRLPHRAHMLTQDENIVDVSLKVQYRIQDAADYLFQDSTPDKTIHDAIESSLREVVGKSTLDDIITEQRSGIAERVKLQAQELLDQYRTGLVVTSVNIQDAIPPEQVKAAFDDAIKAREDKERSINQAEAYANDVVPRARGGAARRIQEAEAHKAKVVAEADGESQRFLALLREYEKAPKVTRERLYLETVQEVLANSNKVILDVQGGNNLTYLPLDRIMQSSGSSSGGNSQSTRSFDNFSSSPMSSSETSGRDTSRTRRTR